MKHVSSLSLGLIAALSLVACSKQAEVAPRTDAAVSDGGLQNYLVNASRSFRELKHVDQGRALKDFDFKGREIKFRSVTGGAISEFDSPWAQKDIKEDKTPGTSTAKAYAKLNLQHPNQVIVAVIDSGMDIEHEDLKANVWTNPGEVAGNGIDDDQNGYVDDVHGWNYLVDQAGQPIYDANLETVRELRRLQALSSLTAEEQAYLTKVQKLVGDSVDEAQKRVALRTKMKNEFMTAEQSLRDNGFTGDVTTAAVTGFASTNPDAIAAKTVLLDFLKDSWSIERFDASIAHWQGSLDTNLSLTFNPQYAGNDSVFLEKGYGNGNVMPVGADEEHATHVAGIIGAVRGNGLGMDGQAQNVRLMSLRVVPNGDERDKDIANAIRYAADNGARVINMSFGKSLSPDRAEIVDAVKYAATKEVLLVHAAGNDAKDNDVTPSFPTRKLEDAAGNVTGELDNFIEIGASTKAADKGLPAVFSNYGKKWVDLFSPGAEIVSTIPGNQYDSFDGTSMASPEVAGIAALVLSQRNDISAAQLRTLLMDTVVKMKLNVTLPADEPNPAAALIPFLSLSRTGGVVNAYKAVKAALAL